MLVITPQNFKTLHMSGLGVVLLTRARRGNIRIGIGMKLMTLGIEWCSLISSLHIDEAYDLKMVNTFEFVLLGATENLRFERV